jgi:hypothetical protein
MKEAATPTTEAATASRQGEHNRNLLHKYRRVLKYMAEVGPINRDIAKGKPVFDSCVNSTISNDIIGRHGIPIIKVREMYPGFGGEPTPRVWYSLPEEAKEAALALVYKEGK